MKTNAGVISAAWAMFAIVAITFCAELLTTVALLYFGYVSDSIGIILTDAAMLAILIAPPIYWLVATPLRRENEKRLHAESRAAELGQLAIIAALFPPLFWWARQDWYHASARWLSALIFLVAVFWTVERAFAGVATL